MNKVPRCKVKTEKLAKTETAGGRSTDDTTRGSEENRFPDAIEL